MNEHSQGGKTMNEAINKFGPVVGRFLIALIFLLSGFSKIGGFAQTAGFMASKGLPMAEALLVITIVIEIGAALMLIVGWQARLGAAALFLWMIPVTLVFHGFWAAPAAQQQIEMAMFLKNLAMMGALLYIMAYGSGRYSVKN
jgi:putative oxidoreductase